jgi:hypothetical protein
VLNFGPKIIVKLKAETMADFNLSSEQFGNLTNYTFSTSGQVVDILDAIYIFVFGIIGGSIGNVLLLLVIAVNRKLWTVPNTYVFSMALSDLIITAEAFPVIFANNVNRRNVLLIGGISSMTACKIQCAIHILSVSVSLYSIMTVAVTRYLCVCRWDYYKGHITIRSSIITNIGIWIVCLILVGASVGFQIVKTEYNPYLAACGFRHSGSIVYVYISNILSIWLPMIITLVCYIMIYKTVHETGERVQQHAKTENPKKLSKKDLTVIRVLFFTYAAFVICWMPYSIMAFVALHKGSVSPIAYKVTVRMCMSNACSNSVVYGLFNPKFRREYTRILCWPVRAAIQGKIQPDVSMSSTT